MNIKTCMSFALILFFISQVSLAQEGDAPSLNKEIMAMDSLLFNKAFNKCDLDLYKKLVSPYLEFYDDRTGLNTDFNKEIAAFKDRCSKSHAVTRKLVRAEVHELGDYGAVEIGVHDFYVNDHRVETAKFIIIWERTDSSYIMKRTVSYEHQPVTD